MVKFELTEEIKKNLNQWELFVAETYNKVYSEITNKALLNNSEVVDNAQK